MSQAALACDVAIVGGGMAGHAAALTLARARWRVVLFDDGTPRNAPASASHGFVTRDGMAPAELRRRANEQLHQYAAVHSEESAVAAVSGQVGEFQLTSAAGVVWIAQRLIVASGVHDVLPGLPDLAGGWGQTILHCPFCHGWEVRDTPLAVLLRGPHDVDFAVLLSRWSARITAMAQRIDEQGLGRLRQRAIAVDEWPVRVTPLPSSVECVFGDGRVQTFRALFLRPSTTPRISFLGELAPEVIDDGRLRVDARGQTTCRGVYAAGDVATMSHQLVAAAASGTSAAMEVTRDLLQSL